MTIFEELYYQLPELEKFYRFEGLGSYSHFHTQRDNQFLNNEQRYIYFSENLKHHQYYTRKRIKKMLLQEILEDEGLNLNKKNLLDSTIFNKTVQCIENKNVEKDILSIEFGVSEIFKKMIENNYINNMKKESNDRRIERVDAKKFHGGYGFCDEWLEIYNLLTYFYSYQRITKENLVDFLYAYRYNLIKQKSTLNAVSFLLNPKYRIIKVNEKIYSDFSKYDLMDALERVYEKKLYFPESMFSSSPNETIKKIIQSYMQEKEHILELSESIYKRELNRNL